MHTALNRPLRSIALLALASLAACAAEADDVVASGAEEIRGGTPASEFPEAATIDISFANPGVRGTCSGAVIAPRVVLTAGHCIVFAREGQTATSWLVTAPFAGGQAAVATRAITDFFDTGPDPFTDSLDVGLLVLDAPISLSSYPSVAGSPQPDGTFVSVLGRVQGGQQTATVFKTATPLALRDGAPLGRPLTYRIPGLLESGDSGGPAIAFGTHTIVAVNSASRGNDAFLARAELFANKIQDAIAQNP